MQTRTERDSIGERQIPIDAYYGAQTHRAIDNFPISGLKPKPEVMRLFKEIVLDVWKKKRADTGETIKVLERKLTDLRQRSWRRWGSSGPSRSPRSS